VGSLASPGVVATLTPIVQAVRNQANSDRNGAWLGLLGVWKLSRVGSGATQLCFSADSIDPQIFRIESRDGRKYAAAAHAADPHACKGPDARY
jgi:hypothetical protein